MELMLDCIFVGIGLGIGFGIPLFIAVLIVKLREEWR